ncbi:MAG: alpha/beta fold hydrolase [Gaiellaceae bacterium]
MTVLLIHAGVCDSRQWERQLALLPEAIAPDLPGFGDTPEPEVEFSVVDDLAALLDGPAAVVGNSLGGRVALQLALARPDLVERLLLVSPGLPGHDWSPEVRACWDAEEEAVERGDLDAATEVCVEFWAQPHVRDVVRPMQRRALELQVGAPEPQERPGPALEPAKVRCPTLIAVGEDDVSDFHEIGSRLAREIPGAYLVTIPGAGHLPNLETPEAFDRLLLEFLQD